MHVNEKKNNLDKKMLLQGKVIRRERWNNKIKLKKKQPKRNPPPPNKLIRNLCANHLQRSIAFSFFNCIISLKLTITTCNMSFFPYKLSIFPKITGNVTYNRIMKTEYNYNNFITYKIPKSFHIYVFPIFCFTPLFLQQVFMVYLDGTALKFANF